MTRGYSLDEIQQKLIDVLSDSKTGLSGVEISERLKVNRATMAKYLNVFAAEGLIKQKSAGNINLWFIESGTEKLHFPDDYFHVKEKFLEYLTSGSQNQVYNLVRNCQHSGASISKIISEIMIPAIDSIDDLYLQAKIGKSESKLFRGIISNSIQILNMAPHDSNPKKNVIVISADSQSAPHSHAASCALGSLGWQVWALGDMSDAIDVMYDLDLQKFLTRIWKQKQGIMVVLVISATDERIKFFSEAVNSVRPKFGKNMHLAIYSRTGKKSSAKAEFVTGDFENAIQWAESVSSSALG
ncbi:ArsR family transcriptional regulator [Candidatus Nitrosotenuis sp. DW1]|uniref:ArsR family transcriptional regulator n=1 Tax=Candidatus Nitrosotenuis sp. DW1 TaxID=2259672 RepID=UPI0015C8E6A0|nr:ArsR family transcriptional regulator [Candidatus Nitrosotenuis sp. DW1]QLH09492.1 ArsR family transcriptional regulator [Candidatus Nitrosotenuis sp. DW1]